MNTTQRQPKLFQLVRPTDVSGVPGTAALTEDRSVGSSLAKATVTLAEGVEWSDGAVALRWYGPWPHTSTWNDIDAILAAHDQVFLRWLAPPPVLRKPTATGPVGTGKSLTTEPADTGKPLTTEPAGTGIPPRPPTTSALWLPAPDLDGLCTRCGARWPCLGCDA